MGILDIEFDTGSRRAERASRISARAIVSGTLVSLAGLGVLLSLAGAFAGDGISRDPALAERFGAGAAIWAAIAWTAAAFAGAFVAARVGGAASARHGILYGVVAWAAACITGAVLLCTWYMAAVGVGILTPAFGDAFLRPATFAAYFVADALALVGAAAGGVLAARLERGPSPARGEVGRFRRAGARSAEPMH